MSVGVLAIRYLRPEFKYCAASPVGVVHGSRNVQPAGYAGWHLEDWGNLTACGMTRTANSVMKWLNRVTGTERA